MAAAAARGRARCIFVVLFSPLDQQLSSGHALVAQQRVQCGLAPTEGLERFDRRAASAGLQDRLPVFSPGLHAWQAIFVGALLERRISVGAEHLGPLVAVVAGRIATRENM